MAKEESIVKSFRISEDLFERANTIFKKEGFSYSEVFRLVCDATIREGRIPRGLSTKEMETKLDNSQSRESYIDGILSMVGIVPERQRDMTAEERLLQTLFHDKSESKDLSNKELRDWAERWGFPDDLSINTLAELFDCGLFSNNPWDGAYDAEIAPVKGINDTPDDGLKDAMIIMEQQNNIRDNLEQIKRSFEIRAIKYLMECNNAIENEKEESNDDN